ncbi:MAG TPA: hypothetical protein V6C65_04030 [Allocoleopsis sp.]
MERIELRIGEWDAAAKFCEMLLTEEVTKAFPDATCIVYFSPANRTFDYFVRIPERQIPVLRYVRSHIGSLTPNNRKINFTRKPQIDAAYHANLDLGFIEELLQQSFKAIPIASTVDEMMSIIKDLLDGKQPEMQPEDKVISDVLQDYFRIRTLQATQGILQFIGER